jgi:hypothetical protein
MFFGSNMTGFLFIGLKDIAYQDNENNIEYKNAFLNLKTYIIHKYSISIYITSNIKFNNTSGHSKLFIFYLPLIFHLHHNSLDKQHNPGFWVLYNGQIT